MTSAEIVVEFVKGRPELEKILRKKMVDVFCAPEMYGPKCADLVHDEIDDDATDEEKTLLDKVRGNGKVDWNEVARAFGAPIKPGEFDPPPVEQVAGVSEKPVVVDWVKARALGVALAKDSAALSAVLLEFEKRIVELDIGVEAVVPIDAETQLRFGKQNGKWGLFVVVKGEHVHVLQQASRAMRIGAGHQAVALLARLMEEGEQMLRDVRGAGERVIDAIEIADEVKRGD